MKSICTKIILGLAGKGLTLKERVIVEKNIENHIEFK